MRRGERGFTVVETLVAATLLLVLGLATLGLVGALARAIAARGSSSGGSIRTEDTLTAMRDDAATAFAVFVPDRDVFGKVNGGAPDAQAHELDYYGKAEDGTETWWAYTYDASAKTLRRWDYVPGRAGGPAVIGVADRNNGAIDGAATYAALTGVRTFTVRTLEANELATAANTFGPAIASLSAAAGATPAPMPVGFVPANRVARSDLYGGNTTLEVSVATDRSTRTFHLATAALASGFTIHETPAIRAFVYRIDVMHRFWFGFAQKTWARIFEQLQYSFTPKNPRSWNVWCDYQIYGAESNGLALNDPHTLYRPNEWSEATAGIFYGATQGDLSTLNAAGCSKRVPSKTQRSATPSPNDPDPDVADTPPPCFVQGTCWPQNAPENWAPPSPWPAASPPPQWCATHSLSTLCGGPGGTPVPITSAPPNPGLTNYTPVPGASAPSDDPVREPRSGPRAQ